MSAPPDSAPETWPPRLEDVVRAADAEARRHESPVESAAADSACAAALAAAPPIVARYVRSARAADLAQVRALIDLVEVETARRRSAAERASAAS